MPVFQTGGIGFESRHPHMFLRSREEAFQCQVAHRLSSQACGSRNADSIFLCEVIGPHERCRVGEHTIRHERAGNGYSCWTKEGKNAWTETSKRAT